MQTYNIVYNNNIIHECPEKRLQDKKIKSYENSTAENKNKLRSNLHDWTRLKSECCC